MYDDWAVTVHGMNDSHNLSQFYKELRLLRNLILVVLALIVFLYIPMYGGLTTDLSGLALTNRYAWAMSAMYLQGDIAGGLLFGMIFVFVGLVGGYWLWTVSRNSIHNDISRAALCTSDVKIDNSSDGNGSYNFHFPLIRVLSVVAYHSSFWFIIVCNFVVMSVLNYYFVLTSEKYEGHSLQINAISAGLALFKGVF
jgi:hypothetical protein